VPAAMLGYLVGEVHRRLVLDSYSKAYMLVHLARSKRVVYTQVAAHSGSSWWMAVEEVQLIQDSSMNQSDSRHIMSLVVPLVKEGSKILRV